MSILAWCDSGSCGSVSAAVEAPSEDRIWKLFTLVKDGQGNVLQKDSQHASVHIKKSALHGAN